MLRDAVERRFTIMGEALREAWRIDPSLASQITQTREIVDFRNLLVHGYAIVVDEAVWRIIHTHLPLLLAEVRALLTE